LTYLVAAVQTMFPEAAQETLALLQASSLPPVPVLARGLANDLDQVESPFILVLDDLHVIRELAIHDLLSELLQHPPQPMHLVIATRREPLLPLSKLRARSQMTEIRADELCFAPAETAALLGLMLERPVDDATAAALAKKTEGWITGLRLAVLALRPQGDLDRLLTDLPQQSHYVREST
jgi:LuxR family maltose regulon positive regulatory protein